MASAQPSSSAPAKEYTVRVQSNPKKKYNIMKFSVANKIDFTQCGTVKLERENNLRDFKVAHDIDLMPKFGAGSEFGREQKEEARRKKYGMATRKYNPYDQPWLMKLGSGKQVKKFKGSKEGGILENTSYFVFTQCSDGAFEACPIEEWYNFNPVIKYRFLNSEEAEEEFNRRDKNLNLRNIMVRKRIKGEEAVAEEEAEEKKIKKVKSKDFKLTEMDDWADSSDDDDSDGDGSGEEKAKKPKKDTGKGKKKKKRKANSDDEAVEESDDQDEGAEVDYMTSSDSEDDTMFDDKQRDQDKYEEKGVAEEKGLQSLIESDGEEEEVKQDEDEDEEEEEAANSKKDSDSESSSSSGSDSDVDGPNVQSALFMSKKGDKATKPAKNKKRRLSGSSEGSAATNSRPNTPSVDAANSAGKRSATNSPVPKKARVDTPTHAGSSDGITDNSVRRYLMRKPMTTKDLLQKFKSKNTGLSKEQLGNTIAQILKRLNPEKQKIKDKLYLSIRKS